MLDTAPIITRSARPASATRVASGDFNLLATVGYRREFHAGTERTNGRFDPGFDVTYTRPINERLALTASVGHNARWEDKDNLAPTWNRTTNIQTQSAIGAQIGLDIRQ